MKYHRPRILDASALVALFDGHPELMLLLEDAAAGEVNLVVPAVAVAEAQAVIQATPTMWEYIMGWPHVTELPLTAHTAVSTGDIARPRLTHHPVHEALIGPLMVAQVVREARIMSGVVVSNRPEAYGAYDDIAIVAF